VKYPGPVIMAENVLRKDTKGVVTASNIEYHGDSGVFYTLAAADRLTMPPDYHTPLQVLGARRAVEIARRARAERDAPNELKEAENRLAVLEQIWQPNRDDDKKFGGEAREVMRLAEAARTQAIERAEAERLSAEPRAAERAISRAESEAEQARAAAAQAKRRAEEYRALLSRTESELAAARQRAGQAQTEADRAKANEDARLEAERARLEAERTRRERDAAMQRLQVSLSEILETRREARGLIVNLSDVLFDFNKASLKPGAKEKLSKLTGVLLAYPGSLRIEIEGHTDSVGTHEYNQKLSEERVASVRSYLLQAGMSADKITAVYGFGETRPVATNDTDVGRQMNRRVEIVIVDTNAPTAASNR
jgi:outer membrane protein OmpA-like peptidoglycan-associated protein